MKFRPGSILLACCSATALIAVAARAQQDDALILPPRVEGDPPAASLTDVDPSGRSQDDGNDQDRPSTARIATPPEALPLEEVIVIGETEWRLPDLGSAWRAAEEEKEQDTDRIELTFLPLHDPENADPVVDLFERNSELHRVELIEIFRIGFGGRPRD